MDQSRDFKGIWIPKELYLTKELNWTEKLLLIEIDSLDTEDHCFASNKYFAEFIGVTQRRVQQCINKLKELGYVEQIYFNGKKRGLKSNLSTKLSTKKKSTKNISPQPRKIFRGCPDENFTHNNIINNLNNIFKIKTKKSKNQVQVGLDFKIEDIVPNADIYREELGNVVDEVENWIKQTKFGDIVDQQWVCKQFITFARRRGLEV